jgi:tol-pal system protein YbgF
MINCKKHIIVALITVMLPLTCWSEAPVIDDSDNFAIMDGQQDAQAPVVNSKYGDPQDNNFAGDSGESDVSSALVKDDPGSNSGNTINANAKLIDKILALQNDVQELRGQLEVQAHDLKMLQQQQVAFYKDLDSRLGGGDAKTAQAKPSTDIILSSNTPTVQPNTTSNTSITKNVSTTPNPVVSTPVSRINPADEQISYLAAYELVKNKRYDNAINAMQTFAQKYPKGGYTANAEYWLGELYLVKKDYSKAIEHFEIVLHQFPSSSKTAASMLKAGYAYTETGNNEGAKKYFEQVIKTWPNTSTAKLAQSKLEKINT